MSKKIPSAGGKQFTVDQDGEHVALSWDDPGFPGGDALLDRENALSLGAELISAALSGTSEAQLDQLAVTREPAFEAVRAYIRSTDRVPGDVVTRNAMIWSGVHAALDALTVMDAPLTETDQRFLSFALDQAAEEKFLGSGMSDDEEASLKKLRKLTTSTIPSSSPEGSS